MFAVRASRGLRTSPPRTKCAISTHGARNWPFGPEIRGLRGRSTGRRIGHTGRHCAPERRQGRQVPELSGSALAHPAGRAATRGRNSSRPCGSLRRHHRRRAAAASERRPADRAADADGVGGRARRRRRGQASAAGAEGVRQQAGHEGRGAEARGEARAGDAGVRTAAVRPPRRARRAEAREPGARGREAAAAGAAEPVEAEGRARRQPVASAHAGAAESPGEHGMPHVAAEQFAAAYESAIKPPPKD